MRNLKKKDGITLIALVVTIIVLLILAGISISMLTGQNSILNRAQEAKEDTETAQKEEQDKLESMEDTINEYVTEIEVEQVTDENPGVLESDETDLNTYIINSIEDLVFFAHDVREGNTYEGKTVKLGLSLDFNSTKSYMNAFRTDYGEYGYNGELKTLLTSGEGFIPIGTERYLEAEVEMVNTFKGTFDGDNNVIYGLYINQKIAYDGEDYDEYSIGLFGYNEGTIRNLGLANNNVKIEKASGNCNVFAGGVTGRNNGTIDNCYNKGNITTNFRTGGITGRNNGTIQNCYNSGKILGSSRVGGIAGESGEFINCYNLGEISSYNSLTEIHISGISTSCNNISKCYNYGNINATSSKNVFASGIGIAETIANCYNLGDITATVTEFSLNSYASASGICSYEGKNISNCYNAGNITSNSSSNYSRTSGIAYGCTISNCYNLGKVLGIGQLNTEIDMGGISSHIEGRSITNSYNIGSIESQGGNNNLIGSILGAGGLNATITNCSYLAETAEKGMGTGTDVTTRINNIEDMPDILTILGSEFKMDENNINKGYPILNWQ